MLRHSGVITKLERNARRKSRLGAAGDGEKGAVRLYLYRPAD